MNEHSKNVENLVRRGVLYQGVTLVMPKSLQNQRGL